MARYFFHLRDDSDELLDEEGVELNDERTVQAKALSSARDTLSRELRDGRLDLRQRIEVEDNVGRVVYALPPDEAFETIRH